MTISAFSSTRGRVTFRRGEDEPQAVGMRVTASNLDLELEDGRRIVVPLAFYPTLLRAAPKQRRDWDFLGQGTGLEWPQLDLQLSVESIIAGRREHIPPPGFREWLEAEWDRLGLQRPPPG